ncbi:MAG: hypothetical protein WC825_02285 [Gallionellaceae bacterium]|jgi:hypothetical protein
MNLFDNNDAIYQMVEASNPTMGSDPNYQVGYLAGTLRMLITGEMTIDEARERVEKHAAERQS